jgi:hypothetical protein
MSFLLAATSGLRLVLRRPFVALTWWLVAMASVGLGLGALNLINVTTPGLVPRTPVNVALLALVTVVLPLFASMSLTSTAVVRAMLSAGDPGFAYLRSGKTEIKTTGVLFLLVTLFALAGLVAVVIVVGIVQALGWPARDELALLAAMVVGWLATFRFAAALPFAVEVRSVGLVASWRLTAQHPWQTLFATAGAVALFALVWLGAGLALTQITQAPSFRLPITHWWDVIFRVGPLIAIMALGATLGQILLVCPGVYIYQRLRSEKVEDVF